jgi:glycosyltransferase involved in cell wall biosynthesis
MVRATVLLPVRNGGRWLEETIQSLEDQTFKDFELLVIDDGSTDNSIDIIKQSNLQHIRIIPGPQQGLAKALALGVNEAKTEIIFRQDQDDISLPSRFQLQYNFLEENKDHVAVGSNIVLINEYGKKIKVVKKPLTNNAIRLSLTVECPLIHPAVAFRKSAVLAAGNYWSPSSDPFPEDFHLWSRLIKNGRISVLSKRLVKYRLSSKGISRMFYEVLAKEAYLIARQNLENRINNDLSTKLNRNALQIYCFRNMKITFFELLSIYKNLYRIKKKSGFKDIELGFSSIVYLRPIWHWVKKDTIKEKLHKNSV